MYREFWQSSVFAQIVCSLTLFIVILLGYRDCFHFPDSFASQLEHGVIEMTYLSLRMTPVSPQSPHILLLALKAIFPRWYSYKYRRGSLSQPPAGRMASDFNLKKRPDVCVKWVPKPSLS